MAGLVMAAAPAWAGQTVTVRVAQGALVGAGAADGGTVFLGVPYARPPLGSLRWKAPQPVQRWRGARSATAAAAPCLQSDLGWNSADAALSAEDCLYLDIRTPTVHPRQPLPVMVWLHGGSNRAGSGRGVLDSSLARSGVVLVSLQYRLGVFGFLSHPALTRESNGRAAGNFGLLDQIAALRWLQRNLSAVGGDPHNVTLFGHSAGAQDIGLLLLSPLARGLFSKAIEQSGSPGYGLPPRTLAENEAVGQQLTQLLGIADDAAEPAALRACAARDILAAGEKLRSPTLRDQSYLWLQIAVDGRIVPMAPAKLLAAGHTNPAPLIVGTNTRELTVPGGDQLTDAFLAESFGRNEAAARGYYGYPPSGPMPAADARLGSFSEQLSADVIFKCPAARTAALRAASGQPVWQYDFGRIDTARQFGHAAELSSVFDAVPLAAAGDAAAPSLQAYWVRFAHSGDPNGPALPRWPRYDLTQRSYMDFAPTGPQPKSDLRGAICALLHRV